MADSLLVMPKLGLTMTEGILSEWLVKPGVAFSAGAPLFVVETDKIATEIEAQQDGVIEVVLVPAGQTVAVGTPVARWTSASGPSAVAPASQPAALAEAPAAATPASVPPPPVGKPPLPTRPDDTRIIATPYARRLARERNIDLERIQGGGPAGRIRAQDLEQAPRIASLAAPAGYVLLAEARADALLAVKEQLQASSAQPPLTLTHWIALAAARALAAAPESAGLNLACALPGPRGMAMPALEGAAGLGLEALARRIAELAGRVRAGETLPADPEALVLYNAGAPWPLKGHQGISRLIPPLGAGGLSLGVGSVASRFYPDSAGAPVLGREIGLALAADPHGMPGDAGLALLCRIVEFLENPMRLLLLTLEK